jgi:putative ABC transport system substrate-binding protein
MAELGYLFGRDFVTEPRGTDDMSRLSELADLKVDMIVATGGGKTLSLLKQATNTVPIIMTAAQDDPVSLGFVQSLARPGTNFTGMSLQSLELTGKRLQILGELVPGGNKTTAIFSGPTLPQLWPAARAYGQAQGWMMVSVEIRYPSEIPAAFTTAVNAGAGALYVPASGLLFRHASQIAELAALNRLPTMYELRPFVDVGGLVSYGAGIEDIWRRAATYVDKIVKGVNPAELPVEQPIKFELVVNARAAKQLDLTVPPSILIRADQIIE